MRNKSAKQKLTLKQSRLIKALPVSDSVAEAGEKAGYHDRQTAHRAATFPRACHEEIVPKLMISAIISSKKNKLSTSSSGASPRRERCARSPQRAAGTTLSGGALPAVSGSKANSTREWEIPFRTRAARAMPVC